MQLSASLGVSITPLREPSSVLRQITWSYASLTGTWWSRPSPVRTRRSWSRSRRELDLLATRLAALQMTVDELGRRGHDASPLPGAGPQLGRRDLRRNDSGGDGLPSSPQDLSLEGRLKLGVRPAADIALTMDFVVGLRGVMGIRRQHDLVPPHSRRPWLPLLDDMRLVDTVPLAAPRCILVRAGSQRRRPPENHMLTRRISLWHGSNA